MNAVTAPQEIAEHVASGEKFTNDEVTGELAEYALTWLADYQGSFEFLVNMKDAVETKGSLSVGQTRGVLNCLLAQSKKSDPFAVAGDVPAGRYALPSADGTHLVFWQVDRPEEGKWKGYVFVSQLLGSPGDWTQQRPTKQIRQSVLARILETGSDKAAQAFGQATQTCGYCASPLSNPQSRAAGYGETCANNHGFFYPTLEEAIAILDELGGTQEEMFGPETD